MHRALTTQDPFTQFRRNFFGLAPPARKDTRLKVNVYEDGERYLVRANIPGFDVSEIEITAVKNQVTIRGERTEEETADQRLHRRERSLLKFERTFSLPKTVNVDTILANFENGFLEIILEWDEAAKPKTIKITQGEI